MSATTLMVDPRYHRNPAGTEEFFLLNAPPRRTFGNNVRHSGTKCTRECIGAPLVRGPASLHSPELFQAEQLLMCSGARDVRVRARNGRTMCGSVCRRLQGCTVPSRCIGSGTRRRRGCFGGTRSGPAAAGYARVGTYRRYRVRCIGYRCHRDEGVARA